MDPGNGKIRMQSGDPGGATMQREIMKDLVALGIIISLLVLFVFEIAHGQPPGRQGMAGLDGKNGPHCGGLDADDPCDPPPGPPPEAFRACQDREPGSASRFTAPGGEVIRGTCRDEGWGRLVLVPDGPEGMEAGGGPCPLLPCDDDPLALADECGDPLLPPVPWDCGEADWMILPY
jgi:hypothetical protein